MEKFLKEMGFEPMKPFHVGNPMCPSKSGYSLNDIEVHIGHLNGLEYYYKIYRVKKGGLNFIARFNSKMETTVFLVNLLKK